MPYRLKRGAPREEEEVRQFGVKIKGRDVKELFPDVGLFGKGSALVCPYERILKSVGK